MPDIPNGLEAEVRVLWGAYCYLRDNPLRDVSGTSRLLHEAEPAALCSRLRDELSELAGVLEGIHSHKSPAEDAQLEGSQVCYWVFLLALRSGLTYEELAPHAQLATTEPYTGEALATALREAAADCGRSVGVEPLRHALFLAGAAQRVFGGSSLAMVRADLAAMRTRPYMAPYFAGVSGSAGRG